MKKLKNTKLSKYIFGLLVLLMVVVYAFNNKTISAAPTVPTLDTAREVVYNDASTAHVTNGTTFVAAYTNPAISRIIFDNDIDLGSSQAAIRGYDLVRSLQIDGNSHTLTARQLGGLSDISFFDVRNASNKTLHLKDMTFLAGGMNIIDDNNIFARSTSWHIILDNIDFPNNTIANEANRILRMRDGHLFLRNKVTMYTTSENMYIGQITVEPNADVTGEINYNNYSTWWFVDANSNGTMNVGSGAVVKLNGVGGATYPTIYQHFRSINLLPNSKLIARKPGNALRFDSTANVPDKYINVFEGATIDASSTGTGTSPIVDSNGTSAYHFYAAPKSNVYFIGSSANDTTPLINLPSAGSSFELDQPARYDLRNNRTTGFVVRVGTGANFKITNSDIEVWNKGAGVNLNIAPSKSWYLSNVVADTNGDPIAGSDATMTGVWKTTNYARITGLNSHPVLTINPITDAHKNYSVNATVLGEVAWANQVNITVTNDKNSDVFTGNNNETGVYNFSNTNFFKAGTIVTAKGYRGSVSWSTEDPQATTVVLDVTPPTPAVTADTISNEARSISGTSDEPGATVIINYNGVAIKDADGNIITTTVKADGTWKFDFPDNIILGLNGKLQILLTDTIGNQNPLVDKVLYDATFKKGTIVAVEITPKLTAPEYIEVLQNSVYNPQTGVTGRDSNLDNVVFGAAEFDLKQSNNVDTSKVGVYTTTYTMKDKLKPTITTTKATKVIVKNSDSLIDYDKGYMLNASNYTLTKGVDTITGSNDEVITNGSAKAYSLSTGAEIEAVVVGDTYTETIGGYPVVVAVKDDESVKKNITVSIVGPNTIINNGYAIDASSFFIAKKDVQGDADLLNTSFTKLKAWNTVDINNNPATANVLSNGGYLVGAAQGTYNVSLNVSQSPLTQINIKASIIDRSNVGSNTSYAIGSNDVIISRKVAKTIKTSQDLINLTNTQSYTSAGVSSPTTSVVLNSNFVETPGVYAVEFGVDADNTVKVTSKITVLDYDNVTTSETNTIVGNDFKINTTVASSITNTEILTKALASAYLTSDDSVKKTVVVGTNNIVPVAGFYNVELYIENEVTTKITIVVEVSNGNVPILNVPTPSEIQVGDTFDPTSGVNALDIEDGVITNDIVITGTYDVDTAGVYVLTYTSTDTDSNVVTAKKVLVVNDGTYVVGTKYIIKANDFVVNKADVDASANVLIANANAVAYKASDATTVDVNLLNINGYTNTTGVYDIEFNVLDEVSTAITVEATVVDYDSTTKGANYAIGANDIILGTEDVAGLTDANIISLSGATSWLNTNYVTKGTVKVEDSSAIQAVVGEYNVILNVNEEITTKTTIKVIVIASDKVVTKNGYGIAANNVVIGKKQAKAIKTNDDLISTNNAFGFIGNDITVNSPIKVLNSDFDTLVGTYNITYAVVADESVKVTVTIQVLDYDVVESGVNYLIGANDFNINTTVAASITDADILTKSGATSWLKDTLAISGTVAITSNTIQSALGTYIIEFYVVEEPDTKVSITVTVSNGSVPILNVPTPSEIQVGDAFDPTSGVNALDIEDGVITNDIVITGTYDINTAGVYVLTYTITDNDFNVVTAKKVLVVNDGTYVVGTKYIIKANDFVVNKTDVDASASVLIANANAVAYNTTDASVVPVNLLNINGYTNVAGVYDIQFNVLDEVSTAITVKATVVDYDVTTKGSNYAIGANNIIVGIEDVAGLDEAKIISLSDATSWKNTNYATKGTVKVEDSSSIQAVVGEYDVILNVNEEIATKTTIKVKVIGSDKVVTKNGYGIAADNVVIGKKQAKAIKTDADLIATNTAFGFVGNDVATTTPIKVLSSDFDAKVGTYNATYAVVADESVKVTVSIEVLDYDIVESGVNYLIGANDFAINTTVAASITDADILSKSGATSWLKDTLAISGTVAITANTIEATEGTYIVEFYVVEEPDTKVSITVTVSNGSVPVLTVPTPSEIQVGDAFDPTTGISSIDDEDGSITDKVVVTGTYDVDTAGVYVLTYTSTDTDSNVVTAKKVLVVNDGTYVVGTKYIIKANDFVVNKADVDASANVLIANANAVAYKTSDATTVDVNLLNINGYTNTTGVYDIEFNVLDEVTTTITVKATVVDYDSTTKGSNYAIGANNIIVGIEDVAGLDEAKIISLSGATSWLNTNYATKGTVKVEDSSLIQAVVGEYDVTLNVNEEVATKTTIKVKVIGSDKVVTKNGYGIAADNIVIGKKQAKAIKTDADLIATNAAFGFVGKDVATTTPIKVLASDFDAIVGTYNITYAVVADESVKVTVSIQVLDYDIVESGVNYLIGANDFNINTTVAASIIDADILSKSGATSWLKDTLAISGTVAITANTIEATEGTYIIEFYVVEEPDTKVSITVTVSNGSVPVLTVPTPSEIQVGDAFDPTTGISSIDDEDGNISDKVVVTGTYDVNVAGVYVLTYTSTDTDSNVVTAKKVLVVNDGTYVFGTKYIIKANDFVVNKADVDASANVLIANANAVAYKTSDATTVDVNLLNINGYTNTTGVYDIEFNVLDEVTTTITVKATVVDYDVTTKGSNYAIGANNIIVGIEDVAGLDEAKIISLSGATSWLNTNYATKGTVKVEDSSAIQAVVGEYNVILNVNEEIATKTTIKVKVIGSDKVVTKNGYGIAADNVVIGKKQAKAIKTDDDLIATNAAFGFVGKDVATTTPIKILSSDFDAVVGSYNITYAVVADESVKVTVSIQVLDYDIVESGVNYLIGANDFNINTTVAASITDADILTKSGATSWLKDTLAISGTVAITENTIQSALGTYIVEFYVVEEPDTKVSITVTVSNGNVPILNVPTPSEIQVGDTFDPTSGVNALDIEDGVITDDIVITGAYDVNTAGVYVLTYTITDKDFNVATAIKVLVVNDGTYVVGTKYIIKANDFVVNKADVDASASVLIAYANAVAYSTTDASVVAANLLNINGYANVAGVYDIEFNVLDEVSTAITVKATVVDYDSTTKGSNYAIGANNIIVGIEDVAGLNEAKIISLSDAAAWKNTNYANKGTVKVEDSSSIQAVVGEYNVILNVSEEKATKTTIKVKVIGSDKVVTKNGYGIAADNVVIGKNQAKAIKTDADLIATNTAFGFVGKDVAANSPIKILSSDFDAKVGTYDVTYAVVADESVKVTVSIQVLDYDVVESGVNYLIGANDFSINTTVAASITDANIKLNSNVTSWLKDTLAISGTVAITANTIEATEGTYIIEFYVVEEPDTKVSITVTVSNGSVPVLTVPTPSEIQVGDAFDPTNGISSVDDEDGNITNKVVVTGTYDVDKAGVYVLTYTITDKDFNVATAKKVLVVNDGTYVVGTKYIIKANDFVVNKADVDATASVLIANANAVAYSTTDASLVATKLLNINGYTNVAGVYDIEFNVLDEVTTTITVKATVVDYDSTTKGSNYAIGANNIIVGIEDVAGLNEAKIISLSDAAAWKNTNYANKGTVKVEDSSSIQAVVGEYNVILNVSEEKATKTTIKVKVIGSDKVVTKNGYGIAADNVVIGKKQAKAIKTDADLIATNTAFGFVGKDVAANSPIKILSSDFDAKVGTYDVTYAVVADESVKVTVSIQVLDYDVVESGVNYLIGGNDFNINTTVAANITDANIKLNSNVTSWLKDTLAISGNIAITANTIEAVEGTYIIEFYVVEEPATKVSIIVTVSNGSIPVLNVPTPSEIQVGDTFDPTNGISSIDDEDGNITDKVVVTGTYDVNVAGVYVLTYTTTDSDFNVVTAKKVLVVNDGTYVVGTKYIIKANDFVVNKADVDANASVLIANANAVAYNATDASAVAVNLLNINGYTNVAGVYDIQFNVLDEVSTSITVKATVVDYDTTTKGTNYAIGANNIILGIEDVKTITDARFISISGATAWKNTNYATKGSVNVEDSSALQAVVGEYDVVLNVNEEKATKTTIKVKVIASDKVVLGSNYGIAADNVVIGKKQATAILTDTDLITTNNAFGFVGKDVAATTPIKVLSSNFLPTVGTYNVTYAVVADESIKVSVSIQVLDFDLIETGVNYLIGANDFTINTTVAASITDADILSKSDATAWLKETLAISGTVAITSNTIEATEGSYVIEFYVVEEPNTKVSITVTVSNGNEPTLNVSSPIEIQVGDTFDPTMEISAEGDEGDITSKITYVGSYDTNTAGIYVLTYTVIDNNYNEVSKKRVLVVNDGSFIVGDKYILKATDYVINKNDVDVDDAKIISLASAQGYIGVYDSQTGDSSTIAVVSKGGYTNKEGVYKITFGSKEETTLTKEINATVVDYDNINTGGKYSIGANNIIISKKDAASITDSKLVSLSGAQAWLNNQYTNKGKVLVDDISVVLPQAGNYSIKLVVDEDKATTLNIMVTVLDYDNVTNIDGYVIASNDIVMGTIKAKTIKTDDDLIKLTNAKAWSKNDLNTELVVLVNTSNYVSDAGEYKVKFGINESSKTLVESNIKVLAADYAMQGDKYTIMANDFKINTTKAATIDEATIIDLAKAKGYLTSDQSNANVKITENTVKGILGSYIVELYVVDEPNTKVKITVVVSNGNLPKLLITTPIEIQVGDAFDSKLDISADDVEDKVITDKISITGNYNVNVPGVYVLTYSITDSDFNKVTAKRVLVVNDGRFVVYNDYIIEASNFIINKKDVNKEDDSILLSTKSKGYKVVDGSLVNTIVLDKSTYDAKVGTYDIKLAIEGNTSEIKTIKATVIDYTNLTVDTANSIGANNIIISKSDVAALNDAKVIELANASAWNNNDYNDKLDLNVENSSDIKASAGIYDVTLNVKGDENTKVKIKVSVVDADEVVNNGSHYISANNIYLSVNDASVISNNDLIEIAKANSDLVSTLFSIDNVQVDQHNIIGQAGVYNVTFSSIAMPSLKVSIKATVLNYDNVYNGNDYIIAANDITLSVSQASKITTNQIIAKSGAVAFLRNNDGDLEAITLSASNVQAIVGDYIATFNVTKDSSTSVDINIKVVEDPKVIVDPTINEIFENDKIISGTGEPGSTITITFPDGSTITTITDKNGKWEVEIPSNINLVGNDTISVISTLDGVSSNKVTKTVQMNINIPKTGAIEMLYAIIAIILGSGLYTTKSIYSRFFKENN